MRNTRYSIKNCTHHDGKCSQQEMLPSRNAVATLTKGDPTQRSMNNYAKLTPSGLGADTADVFHMGPASNPSDAKKGVKSGRFANA